MARNSLKTKKSDSDKVAVFAVSQSEIRADSFRKTRLIRVDEGPAWSVPW
jgi:hypothetical protein